MQKNLTLTAGALDRTFLILMACLSPFVFVEPAPFDLLALLGILYFGIRKYPKSTPKTQLLALAYICFVVFSVMLFSLNNNLSGYPAKYLATQIYLTMLFCVVMKVMLARPHYAELFIKYMTIMAVMSSALVIALKYTIDPDVIYRDVFKIRLKGFFEDPNVLGPFLILPLLALFYFKTFSIPFKIFGGITMMALMALTYSRGAAAAYAFAVFTSLFLTSLNRHFVIRAFFLSGMFGAILILISLGNLGLNSSIHTEGYLQSRLRLQDYDQERFSHLKFAIQEGLTNPFGIGPGHFATLYGNNPHNLFLGKLTDVGYVPTLITLAVFLLALKWSLQHYLKFRDKVSLCLFSSLLAHFLLSSLIYTHHWRHLILSISISLGFCLSMKARDQIPGRRPLGKPSYDRLRRNNNLIQTPNNHK